MIVKPINAKLLPKQHTDHNYQYYCYLANMQGNSGHTSHVTYVFSSIVLMKYVYMFKELVGDGKRD